MRYHRLLAVLVLAALVPLAAQAQKMYKWVDEAGNVSYHDRPPPEGAGYRVEEKDIRARGASGADDDLAEVARRFPVVLYSVPKCAPCDLARAYLDKRKVPYSERNVEKDPKLQEELRSKTGGLSVPTVLVGSKVMNGYMESLLEGELDQAGYPRIGGGKPGEPEAAKPPEEVGGRAPTQ